MYHYVFKIRESGARFFGVHVIDTEWLASILGRGHKVAKVDRKVWWCRIPMEHVNEESLRRVLKRKHDVDNELLQEETIK